MDPKQIQGALDAIEAGDAAKALEILKGLIASAAGGGAPPPPEGGEPLAEGADPAAPKPGDEKVEQAAMTKKLDELTAAVTGLTKTVATVTAERDAAQLSERCVLVADLVKLGAEVPATAWDGDPKDRKPAKHLLGEPIADMRSRVEKLRAARKLSKDPTPPERETTGEADLSPAELVAANKIKDPAQRARFVELRLSRKVNTNG